VHKLVQGKPGALQKEKPRKASPFGEKQTPFKIGRSELYSKKRPTQKQVQHLKAMAENFDPVVQSSTKWFIKKREQWELVEQEGRKTDRIEADRKNVKTCVRKKRWIGNASE